MTDFFSEGKTKFSLEADSSKSLRAVLQEQQGQRSTRRSVCVCIALGLCVCVSVYVMSSRELVLMLLVPEEECVVRFASQYLG